MTTEPPAYYARVFEDEGESPQELIARYRAGVAMLRKTVAEMDHEALVSRPIRGKMSSLEVVGHVADSDQFLADRMKRTIATDRPLLIGVDGDGYLRALAYQDRDLELQLALVEATRMQMAADLDRLDEEAWSRSGMHSEVGLLTLRQMLLHAIRHLEAHAATIAEKRAALGL
jgi:hypothetical protein